MTAPVPLTVVGGYLGAGKTTLINGLLRGASGRRLAVLVNEFGALPIDEDLIIARSENLMSIAGGCICCAFGDSLTDALTGFAGMETRPDHILVEASGVAIPSSIAATASLVNGVELHGNVVLADAQTVRGRARDRFMGDTIRRQLAGADIVVLTRSELVDRDGMDAVTAWVASETGHDNVVTSTKRQVPVDVLLDLGPTTARASDVGHEDVFYDSLVLQPKTPLDARELARRLVDERLGVIRAEGSGRGCRRLRRRNPCGRKAVERGSGPGHRRIGTGLHRAKDGIAQGTDTPGSSGRGDRKRAHPDAAGRGTGAGSDRRGRSTVNSAPGGPVRRHMLFGAVRRVPPPAGNTAHPLRACP